MLLAGITSRKRKAWRPMGEIIQAVNWELVYRAAVILLLILIDKDISRRN